MQQRYSSVNGTEVCDGLAKVVSLAGFRQSRKPSAETAGGVGFEAPSGDSDKAGGDGGGDREEGGLTMRAS
jgi:hypothetical protein